MEFPNSPLKGVAFHTLKAGNPVTFEASQGHRGPIAKNIRLAQATVGDSSAAAASAWGPVTQ